MSDHDYILSVLQSDLLSLGKALLFFGVLWLIPACIVSYVAATRTEPTLWLDVPLGILWGWLAGVPALAVSLGLAIGLMKVATLHEHWLSITFILAFSGSVVVVANYRAAVWCFRRRIEDRLGWKISDPPTPAANRGYSFSLRNLLLVQIALAAVFAIWIGARRDEIEARRKTGEERAYRQDLEARFGGYGWTYFHATREGLWLGQENRGGLIGFDDQVLERLGPRDRLFWLTVRSDQLTDTGLEILSRNSELKKLEIDSSKITDAGIVHLKKLTKLERLEISGPQLTERALTELQSLESLQQLIFFSSKIPPKRGEEFEKARPQTRVSIFSFAP